MEFKDFGEQRKLEEFIIRTMTDYTKTKSFVQRKVTDTPTDSLQVVPRGYVTNNGTLANRPTPAVTGQPYFATDLGNGTSITYNGTNWVNGASSVIA